MKIGVPKETIEGEKRVALVPETVRKLCMGGHLVGVQTGAGSAAGIPDSAYEQAGADLIGDASSVWAKADVVVKVAPPTGEESGHLGTGSTLIGFLQPLTNVEGVGAIARSGATSLAMEAIPRISRAQSMDALSSQATVGGYLAVLEGARELPRFFPMLMTAAGTIPPANVLVLGAGVAGLFAIGTAKRMGARVTAFDIRATVKEQVESLGAKFLEVEGAPDGEGTGGYARELDADTQRRQAEALAAAVAKADVVITTALVPGRPAPKLVTRDAVHAMKPGSVVVDLAGEAGGNCELTVPGTRVVTEGGVVVTAPLDLPSQMPEHASQLYSRNLQSLLELLSGEDGALNLNFDDEIIAGACVTRGGEIVHPGARDAATRATSAA